MIIAIDPGGCTGIAYLTREGHFGTAQIEGGAEGMWVYLRAQVDYLTPIDAVVCETYRQRPGALSSQDDAAHIIGALRYLCWKHNLPLIMQSPAQAKAFSTNKKLKAAGWYTPGMDHARDAARHLLVWLCSNNHTQVDYQAIRNTVLGKLLA